MSVFCLCVQHFAALSLGTIGRAVTVLSVVAGGLKAARIAGIVKALPISLCTSHSKS